MSEEILNIDYHVKQMCLKALNRTQKIVIAAQLLGVSARTLYRYMQEYGIVYDKKNNQFKFKSEKALLI